MSLKYGLLGLLHYGDMTGYELSKAFHASLSFFWETQQSQIYRELNKLEAEGLLSSRVEIQTDKPNKRIYTITESGVKAWRDWLASAMPEEIIPTRSEVLMRLFFSAERDSSDMAAALRQIAETYRLQTERMKGIGSIIEEYKAIVPSERETFFWELTADFGYAYSKMCQTWAENCLRRLEDADL